MARPGWCQEHRVANQESQFEVPHTKSESLRALSNTAATRSHPGRTQVAPRSHPGRTQVAPRSHPGRIPVNVTTKQQPLPGLGQLSTVSQSSESGGAAPLMHCVLPAPSSSVCELNCCCAGSLSRHADSIAADLVHVQEAVCVCVGVCVCECHTFTCARIAQSSLDKRI